jgi:hypothetical protein
VLRVGWLHVKNAVHKPVGLKRCVSIAKELEERGKRFLMNGTAQDHVPSNLLKQLLKQPKQPYKPGKPPNKQDAR